MDAFGTLQGTLLLVLSVLALGAEIFALVDALRHRADAFVAAGKRTKTFWLAILGVALALGIIGFGGLGFVSLIGFVAAAVYLADVRPALRQVSGRGRRNDGPYGPW
jgi:hypothetical protein